MLFGQLLSAAQMWSIAIKPWERWTFLQRVLSVPGVVLLVSFHQNRLQIVLSRGSCSSAVHFRYTGYYQLLPSIYLEKVFWDYHSSTGHLHWCSTPATMSSINSPGALRRWWETGGRRKSTAILGTSVLSLVLVLVGLPVVCRLGLVCGWWVVYTDESFRVSVFVESTQRKKMDHFFISIIMDLYNARL